MAKIGFIGMGNMGSAILNGLLRVYKPEDLLFTAAHKEKMEAVTAKTGVFMQHPMQSVQSSLSM